MSLIAAVYSTVLGLRKRTWVSGMTVRKNEIVKSPADNEDYERITATGGGTTDPADDVTNYVSRSYLRTVALPATHLHGTGNGMGGAVVTSVATIAVNTRTSVLSVTGRGALSYLGFVKDVTGSGTRVEIVCDGRNVYNVAGSSSPGTSYGMLAFGLPYYDTSSVISLGIAVESPTPLVFRRTLQVFVTPLSAGTGASPKLGYIVRSDA